MYRDVVALSLLLPLESNISLLDDLGDSDALCLRHCKRIIKSFEEHWETSAASRICASKNISVILRRCLPALEIEQSACNRPLWTDLFHVIPMRGRTLPGSLSTASF